MSQIREKVDVCIVGAGHAGCEAALACARMGLETVIFTVSVDSIALMDALRALSTSKMYKFLKTRKGELIRIETSAPISMQVGDKYAQQPAKITLPWVATAITIRRR